MPGIQPMDLGQAALGPMALAQRMDLEAAKAPHEIAHVQSLARLQRAQATEAEMRVDQDTRLAELSRGWNPTPGVSQQDNLISLGTMALKAGAVNDASKIFSLADQAGQRDAMRDWRAVQATEAGVRISNAYNQFLTNSYGAVKDPRDPTQLAFARQMFLQQARGLPGAEERANQVEEALRTHGVAGVRMLHEMGVGQKTVGIEATREAQEKLRLAELQRRERMDAFSRRIRQARLQLQADREAAKEKSGGKDVATPSDRQVAAAKAHLALQGVDEAMDDKEEFASFSREVASMANVLRKGNPSLSESESFQRAYQSILGTGAVKGKPKKIFGVEIPGTDRPSYSPSDRAGAAVPKVGDVRRGFRYKGGDPSKQESWEAVK